MDRKKKLRNILFLFGIGISFVWTVQIIFGYTPLLDQFLNQFVQDINGTFVYSLFRFLTGLGSRQFLIPFVLLLSTLLLFLYRSILPSIVFAGGILLTHLLNQLIKLKVERTRPSILEEANATGFSFPSGHAMISLVCYGLLCYFLNQKMKRKWMRKVLQIVTTLLVFFIGISRYFIHVHYMTDVVVGFVTGGGILIILIYLYERTPTGKKHQARLP